MSPTPPEWQPDASGHASLGEHRYWWERFGDGSREAIVLLNGLAMHTGAWYGLLEELRPGFDVVLFDYLGQGGSSCPDEPYSIPEFADALAAILDTLAIERVHVMGISYGGFVALDFARLHPSRLGTLLLSGILISRERQFEMYQDLSLRFYDEGPERFGLYTHYLYEKIFGEDFLRRIDPQQLEAMRARFEERYRDRIYCLVRLTRAQDPFFDGLDDRLNEYRAIRAPTLVVAGTQDRAVPLWQQVALLDVLPNARMLRFEGCGHVVHLERRTDFFRVLRSFAGAGGFEGLALDGDLELDPRSPDRPSPTKP